MDVDIVSEVNGRLVFGDAVARIAETLSPLGAAARLVAEAGALSVQLRKLSLEGRQIEAERLATITRLDHRQVAVGETIHDMHRTVDATERNAQELRRCIANAQREILKAGVSILEKEIYRDLLSNFTTRLVDNHATGGRGLTEHIHEILNGDGAVPARRDERRPALDPSRRQPDAPRRRDGPSTRSRRSR